MRLLLNYKGINKILSKVQKYSDIVQFVNENFFLKMSKWSLVYIDSDGDTISLDSDLDVQTMLETVNKDHLKVYIKDSDDESKKEEVNGEDNTINVKEQNCQTLQEQVKQQNAQKSEVIQQKVQEIKEVQKERINVSSKSKSESENFNQVKGEEMSSCRWRKQWKKKLEEKMAKFVDERVQSLIPCLVKKIQEKIKDQEPEKNQRKEGITHEVKCIGCGVQPIVGIRYKCVSCASFNFCQKCQDTVSHNHNMIKMRFLEEPEVLEQQVSAPWKHWGGHSKKYKHHHKDEEISFTKKCFKMSGAFGGQPQQYRQFVQNNRQLKFKQLSELYLKNNQNAKITDEVKVKVQQRLQKLAFYFKESKENFSKLVEQNPCLNFKELTKLAKKSRADEEKAKQESQQKMEQVQVEQKKQQQCIEQIKDEESKVKEIVEEQEKNNNEAPEEKKQVEADKIENEEQKKPEPVVENEEKKGWFFNWGKKNNTDVKKRNDCLLLMKDYFGAANTFQYLKFYDENQAMSNEDIISKYFDRVAGDSQ